MRREPALNDTQDTSSAAAPRTPPAFVVAVVIPCYRETEHIMDVLGAVPADVARIYCVDDGCPDGTGDLVEQQCRDPRVQVLRNVDNQGVGGAMVTGYRQALADGADIIVKIDGDGQMDPARVAHFVRPIAEGRADYTKGNRFFQIDDVRQMPLGRLIGNAGLSFLTKLSTGYWRVFDPTNGYTAIHANVLGHVPLDRVSRGYFFESDMLFRLATMRAVVEDIPHPARYGQETSHVRVVALIPKFLYLHVRNFAKRLIYNYFLRDFHVASVEWLFGPAFLAFGLIFGGLVWREGSLSQTAVPTGTIMLSALAIIVGLQMLLSALGFDIDNQPERPVHPYLEPPARGP